MGFRGSQNSVAFTPRSALRFGSGHFRIKCKGFTDMLLRRQPFQVQLKRMGIFLFD